MLLSQNIYRRISNARVEKFHQLNTCIALVFNSATFKNTIHVLSLFTRGFTEARKKDTGVQSIWMDKIVVLRTHDSKQAPSYVRKRVQSDRQTAILWHHFKYHVGRRAHFCGKPDERRPGGISGAAPKLGYRNTQLGARMRVNAKVQCIVQ